MISEKTMNLQDNTSIKIGPTISYLEITNKADLLEIGKIARKRKLNVHVLGEGTNSYFSDNRFKLETKYLFVKLNFPLNKSNNYGIQIIENHKIINENKDESDAVVLEVHANVNWHNLVKYTIKNNLWGLENLSYIPGTVGAAPVQNIGAYGTELKNTFSSCDVFDITKNKFRTFNKKDCKFGNRDSIFKSKDKKYFKNYIILSVTFKLSTVPNTILNYSPLSSLSKKTVTQKQISNLVIETRREKLPDFNVYPNSGSFFKNPTVNFATLKKLQEKFPDLMFFKEKNKYKIALAWILENVIKMKGVQDGNIGTWKNHSLVIVNYSDETNTKASELNKFVRRIKRKVKKETGLEIEQEVNFVD